MRQKYGNRHAIFDQDAFWGTTHNDQFNATDVPIGTVRHFSNYVEEKTGIPQDLVNLAFAGLGLYAGYKIVSWVGKNLK